jgi:hypothetical protein
MMQAESSLQIVELQAKDRAMDNAPNCDCYSVNDERIRGYDMKEQVMATCVVDRQHVNSVDNCRIRCTK